MGSFTTWCCHMCKLHEWFGNTAKSVNKEENLAELPGTFPMPPISNTRWVDQDQLKCHPQSEVRETVCQGFDPVAVTLNQAFSQCPQYHGDLGREGSNRKNNDTNANNNENSNDDMHFQLCLLHWWVWVAQKQTQECQWDSKDIKCSTNLSKDKNLLRKQQQHKKM